MPAIVQKIRLTSAQHYGRRVPAGAVGEVLRVLPAAVRQSICMGFLGRSTSKGRRPMWLQKAADIRLAGLEEDRSGDTLLCFEAPTLGEAASEFYQQGELWPSKPDPADTGFDLLEDVLTDVTAKQEDSERFDTLLLNRLIRFWRSLAGGFDSIYLSGHRYPEDQPAAITAATIAAAQHLFQETPVPQRVRVVGKLDMIWQSRQGFQLLLDDSQEIRGVLMEGEIASLTPLFNQRVVVHGRAMYRPSGHLLRVDAERIDLGTGEPGLWSRIPPGKGRKLDVKSLMEMQTPKSGVAAIFGKWPGDETEDQLLDVLKRMG